MIGFKVTHGTYGILWKFFERGMGGVPLIPITWYQFIILAYQNLSEVQLYKVLIYIQTISLS